MLIFGVFSLGRYLKCQQVQFTLEKKNLQLYSTHNSGWLQPEAKMII